MTIPSVIQQVMSALSKVPPDVVLMVAKIVRAAVDDKDGDPVRAAKRAAAVVASEQASEAFLRQALGRSDDPKDQRK
jgi:hypothetical protein